MNILVPENCPQLASKTDLHQHVDVLLIFERLVQSSNIGRRPLAHCRQHTDTDVCYKPNSITLASSVLAPNMFGASLELVRSWFEAEIWPII